MKVAELRALLDNAIEGARTSEEDKDSVTLTVMGITVFGEYVIDQKRMADALEKIAGSMWFYR